MRIKIIFVVLCFALLGCDVKLESEETLGNGELKNVTELSTCRGATPSSTNLFNTQWRLDFVHSKDSEIRYEQIFRFDSGSVSMALTCSKGFDNKVRVQVRAAATFSGSEIHLLSDASQQSVLNVNGEQFECKAEINSGSSMKYRFEGPCLVLRDGGQDLTLVPTFAAPFALEPNLESNSGEPSF